MLEWKLGRLVKSTDRRLSDHSKKSSLSKFLYRRPVAALHAVYFVLTAICCAWELQDHGVVHPAEGFAVTAPSVVHDEKAVGELLLLLFEEVGWGLRGRKDEDYVFADRV